MAKIKNLVFDLGGVLLNIDFNKTSDAFKRLGAHNFDELYSLATAVPLFEALEMGKIPEEEFYIAMQQYCHPSTTKQHIENAWNALLLNFRIGSLEHLKKLKEKYNIYLLSNTNSIHVTAFNKIFREQTSEENLDDYFIKAYYSHKMFERKPHLSAYQFVLDDAKIKAEETLFIDDSIKNIEGAKKAGLHVYHLLPGQTIEDIPL